MNKIIKYSFISFIFFGYLILHSCEKDKKSGLPTDGDGNEYDTVVIGPQVWLKQNLKATKYRNGDQIYLVTDNTKWTTWTTGAYCWYDNNPYYKETYGALYNWKAASTDFLCPGGWHVPTTTEWRELIAYLGGEPYAGGKLKETGTVHWISESQGTTNETGFTALPGGLRYLDGTFQDIRVNGFWWMSDMERHVLIHHSTSSYSEGALPNNPGFSIRCIKDK